MKRSKGFTLIELLAVIVILAIIALIATPLVLKYIEKARSESTIRSAENYIDAVEHAITAENFKGGRFNPSVCEIKNDGNLLCDDRTIKVEVKGEVPSSGTITIENEKIKDVELVYQDKTIVKEDGKLVYLKSGLYDAEGNLIASWDELVKDYGIDIEKDYMDKNGQLIVEQSELLYLKFSQGELSKGTKLIIDKSVKEIGDGALAGCSSLKEIVIPNSVTSIGCIAFGEVSNLTSIIIPNSVTSIGSSAFSNCFSLEEIIIPNSVTSLGAYVFAGCTSLKEMTIPSSVTSIGFRAYMNCSDLTKITIPNSVTSIDEDAFKNGRGLKTINYTGTQEQWDSISKESSWDYNTPTDKVINYNYVIPQN